MTVVTKPLTAAEKKKEAEANSAPLVQVETEIVELKQFYNFFSRLSLNMSSRHGRVLTSLTYTSPS